jgi:hypothetical protein
MREATGIDLVCGVKVSSSQFKVLSRKKTLFFGVNFVNRFINGVILNQ